MTFERGRESDAPIAEELSFALGVTTLCADSKAKAVVAGIGNNDLPVFADTRFQADYASEVGDHTAPLFDKGCGAKRRRPDPVRFPRPGWRVPCGSREAMAHEQHSNR